MHRFTHLVFMGVSGCGKTTAAELAAQHLNWPYAEADEFHPQANIDKMASGHPLNDDDRLPWLRIMRDWMTDHTVSAGTADGTESIENSTAEATYNDAPRGAVVTCSALKRSYRDILREATGRVVFIQLDGPMKVVAGRMVNRKGHFMPTSLLQSQYDTLESLAPDEDGVIVDLTETPAQIVEDALREIGLPANLDGGHLNADDSEGAVK